MKAPKKNAKAIAGVSKKTTRNAPSLPAALDESAVYHVCPTNIFDFKSTKDLKSSHNIIAQERAVRAINMGLGIRRPGYNIYVSGFEGTGKTSVIRQFLEEWSKNASAPSDWVYLHNFTSPESPRAVSLAPGDGRIFKRRMEQLVKAFKAEIPAALQSEEYENSISAYLSNANDRKAKLYSELEKLAKSMDFIIKSTRLGIETIPIVEGRQLTEKEYTKLPDETREHIENQRTKLEPEVLDFARKIRTIESETREYIEKSRRELGLQIVTALTDPLMSDYKDHREISDYLTAVRDDVVENLLDFVESDDSGDESQPQHIVFQTEERDPFVNYKVNVFIDNGQTQNAPVIIETNPTYYNLFGKIEKNVEHGMYLTDFTMIKSGSIHKANGGYLVLNALDIFRQGNVWETLKRILKNRKGFIEDMGEQYSLLPTSGLRPEAIPLDLKVILIGNDEIYHVLFTQDEEFHKIFKIKADFDYKMPRTPENVEHYVSFIATRTNLENLLSFDRSGVAAFVEYGSRLVEDQHLLSTQFGELKDLTIEADFIARENGSKTIRRQDVEEALNQKYYRLNLQEETLLNLVRNEDILVAVDGSRIGQINGLAVYDFGDYSFGKISRITATASVSDSGIINVERASRLSGKIHDKGIMILNGLLMALLAREKRLGMSVSVAFEQNYGLIDGDSASVAELIAIISAMSGIPIRQNFAITGSVNQHGDIQPIGGVNEKIEGFHKCAQLIGKGKEYGAIIPHQNVRNLMLHESARESVRSGYLKIHPVSHIWEAFELVTGVKLGVYDVHQQEAFAPHSALAKIHDKLETLAKRLKAKDAPTLPAASKKPSRVAAKTVRRGSKR